MRFPDAIFCAPAPAWRSAPPAPGCCKGTPGLRAGSELSFTPEDGAELRVLRWNKFVQGDEDQWKANTEAFTEATGVPVKLEAESWEDIRPKAAVAANIGSGPDIIFGWYDDPHQYPDKLVPLTDLAEYLGNKYGGWYDAPKRYGMRDGEWIGLPLGAAGGAHGLSQDLGERGRLRGIPDRHAADPRMRQEAAGQRPSDGHGARPRRRRRQRLDAQRFCGASAARWSTTTTRSSSTARRRSRRWNG